MSEREDGDWAVAKQKELDDLNTCVRCGDSYESYDVFVKDNFNSMVEHSRMHNEWDLHEDGNDGFCKPCRMAVTDYGAYLTDSEREELEPKTDPRLDEIGDHQDGDE